MARLQPDLPPLKPVRVIRADMDSESATEGLAALWHARRLMWRFVSNDLRNRYTGSAVGFFWTVVNPLMELITYTFVFHVLIGVSFHPAGGWTHYALFLFCGMVTWFGVQEGVTRATTAIGQHGHLIKKVHFPVLVLPGYVVMASLVNQVIRLGVLCGGALVVGQGLSWHLVLVPLVLVVQVSFVLGLGLLLSTAQVYFKDTIHGVKALLLIWMFVTPIFYPAAVYPKEAILLLQLNPLAHLVGVYHELILNQRLPHPHNVLVITVIGVFTLLVGYAVFHHHRERFSDLV